MSELDQSSENKLDLHNKAFMRAVAFVNQTNQNIFLTGKAGTGKTTFLKYIRENSYKKLAVAAPTGVAAMNAGGTTLHSLFWLPFGAFIEDFPQTWDNTDHTIYNKARLFSTIKLTKQKRAILQELELLIIDEVSMVRSDTIDAINVILQSVRRDMRPFGGLQILFIGDLYQLPPVVKDNEWVHLKNYYSSMFFFDAKVLREHPVITLELDKIYRQKDLSFISILNAIRNNQCDDQMLKTLNSYYQPDFVVPDQEQYITLTSHNRIAERINADKLDHLTGKLFHLKAVIKDEFSQGSFPAEENLSLKIGAQVMFIRNDSGDDRKYYNGKIGVVKEVNLQAGRVTVGFFDQSEEDVVVKKEIWENIKYKYDKGEDKITEEILGTFSQFPLRLAWAITIHKSQGLTFDRAIIDAGTSFAAGQVYVALSRLTNLEGLVLRSVIPAFAIRTDAQVLQFVQWTEQNDGVEEILEKAQRNYLSQILLQSFRWDGLVEEIDSFYNGIEQKAMDQKLEAQRFFAELSTNAKMMEKVAHKFITVLYELLRDKNTVDYVYIAERTTSAVNWFLPKMQDEIIQALTEHIEAYSVKKRTKKYIAEAKILLLDFKRKFEQLQHCLVIANALQGEGDFQKEVNEVTQLLKTKEKEVVAEEAEEVTSATDTKQITLNLYHEGLSIEEIATKRGMVKGTIYGHLIHFVGESIEATELISQEKLDKIVQVIKNNQGKSSSELKMILGNDVDYPEIKIAQKVLGDDH